MKFRVLLSLVLWLGLAIQVQAQFKFSDNPDEFAKNIQGMMNSLKTPATIKRSDSFLAAWNGGSFSENQKKTIIALAQQMGQKRMKPRPNFETLVATLDAAANIKHLDETKMTNFLDVARKVAEKQRPVQLQVFLETCRTLFEKDALYTGNNYTLKASNTNDIGFYYMETTDTASIAAYTAPQPSKFKDLEEDAAYNALNSDIAKKDSASGIDPTMIVRPTEPKVTLQGAIISFDKTDLTFKTAYDSSTIEQTSGSFMVTYSLFVGEGGRFDWRMAGLDPSDVYCDLKKYIFMVRIPEFAAKDVTLHYKSKLDETLEGIFEFKSRRYKLPSQAQFPRFKSYKSGMEIRNLGDDVMFRGGFSLAGANISSASASGSLSTLKIKDQGEVVFVAKSPLFNIGDSVISARSAGLRINVESDSITHPAARMFYNRKTRHLEIHKDGGQYKFTPFMDTYHKIEISCEGVKWDLDSAKVGFYMFRANNRNAAYFESLDFFKDNYFDNLQGGFSYNPLLMVIGYANSSKKETFNAGDLANKYGQNLQSLKGGLAAIAANGFIRYNTESGAITVLDKAKHYYTSHKQKKDYDYMSVPSIAPRKANGTLDLKTKELLVSGVDKFYLSDSLGVYIIPTDRQVRILKNRDMMFDGKVNAGSFLAHGTSFKFDYTNFTVDLQKIDSVILQLDSKEKAFGKKKSKSTGKLENRGIAEEAEGEKAENIKATKGTLYINEANNKAGLRKVPKYPIFDVMSNSFVYFDTKEVLNKAYDQKVRFKLPPFNVDSVASNDPNSVSFDGTFIPDRIFPPFKERLVIRPDKSLGFIHKVPDEGYQLYNGAGKFFGVVTLDHKGIRGKGEIQYLTSLIKSDDFIFYQDSVVTNGTTFVMKEGTIANGNYPDAAITAFHMKWTPATDSLVISNIDAKDKYAADYKKLYNKTDFGLFKLYEKTATLDGALVVATTGVNGSGKIKTRGSQIVSPNYTFGITDFSGREAIFEIQSSNALKPAVLCRDVKFNFNLKEKFAEFNPEKEGYASNEFPYTRYKTSIPRAVWYLDRKVVEMEKPENVDISNSYFYSTNPEQDSINFNATAAVYNIEKFQLNIKGVPFINIADARIEPDSGKVVVSENATMEVLNNAIMVVDTLNKYHRLVKANVHIFKRNDYSANALYQYVNSDNDTLAINFDEFKILKDEEASTKKQSVYYSSSGGDVFAEKPLKLTPGILYKGKVHMDARKPNLDFDGEVRLDIKNNSNIVWFKYANKESRDFALNLSGAKDESGADLKTGLFIQDGEMQAYTSFAAPRKSTTDKQVFAVDGLLKFQEETREFKVGTPDKIAGKSYEGNVFTYNDSLDLAHFEGRYDLMTPPIEDRDFRVTATGTGQVHLDSNHYDMNMLIQTEFDMPSAAWKQMGKALAARASDLSAPEANDDQTALLYKIADAAGDRAAQDYSKAAQAQVTPIASMISKLAKGLVLSNVNLKWSKEHSSWYSVGKIGVSNVIRENVNAKIDGYLEIKKGASATLFTLYLEASPDTWYYFMYDNASKRLMTASSDDDYNNAVASKSKAAAAKANQYAFAPSDPIERVMFIKNFNKDYFGKEITLEMLEKERAKEAKKQAEEDNPFGSSTDDEPAKDSTNTSTDSTQKAVTDTPAAADSTQKVAPKPAEEDDGFGSDEPAKPTPAAKPAEPEKKDEEKKVEETEKKEGDSAEEPSAEEDEKAKKKAEKEAEKAAKEAEKEVEKKQKEEEKKRKEDEKKAAEEAKKEAERKRLEEEKKKAEEKKKEEEDAGGF
ncbi:hypothetical protein SAMN05421780_10391 [Flexibacter flexilis DSM 6793]|uniref:Uncharacterized protein n=1 Tax=Flexibacter flexilis DSM 6793 TaxID=927664 RepID=A0A1I1GUD8_9BACT|nr:hypothetical protein [Flexibacter flexilis]SFC15095.1 hypothetical protein SAMN05421780_10391 [Flexibacter flexilis DSM 6793]